MKIKEICEYGKKSKIKAGEGLSKGNVKFFTSSSESNKFVKKEQFTNPGIIMGTGGNATLHYCDEPFSVSTDCIVLFPKIKVSPKYLYYFFKGNFHVLQSGFKGAGLKHTSKKYIDEISLNHIPSNDEQVQIVNILDNVNDIIVKKNQQLQEYDQLIKSRFVEMFGDIRSNSRALTSKSGKDLFKFSSGKFLSEDKRYNSGIPVYGGNGIAWYTDNPLIKHSTLIIGRVGAYCGNVQLVEEPVWITDNAIYIKEFYDDSFNLDFLFEMMKIIDFSRFADYSGQPKITQKPLEDMQYLIPKRQEQEDFSLFVKQVDKLKFVVQQSLDETQKLFDSLMQKYFG